MRNRIAGVGGVLVGTVIVVGVLLADRPIPTKLLLGGLLFIGMGAYYCWAGRKGVSLKEFVVDGKVLVNRSEDKQGQSNL